MLKCSSCSGLHVGSEEKGEVKVFWASEAPGHVVVPFTGLENSIEMTRLQGRDQSVLLDFWYLICL